MVKNLPAMQEMKVQSPDWEEVFCFFFFLNAKNREAYEVKGERDLLPLIHNVPSQR